MKESTTSLRLFFGAVGLLTLWSVYETLSLGIPMGIDLALTAYDVIVVLAYLYFAWTLPSYLNVAKVSIPKMFVVITLVISLGVTAYWYFQEPDMVYAGLVGTAINVLISLYLISQLNKLSK
jgi:hypothetical protein